MNAINPIDSLGRFLHGIHDFYRDKALSPEAAKAKMYDEALKEISGMMKSDPNIPDHALVIASQMLSDLLNHRGYKMTEVLKKSEGAKENQLEALRQIKALKDAVDLFISTYKGEEA